MNQSLAGMVFIGGIILLAAALATLGCQAKSNVPASAYDAANLIGNWTGKSTCVGNNPYCHDEKVVYRIAIAVLTCVRVNNHSV